MPKRQRKVNSTEEESTRDRDPMELFAALASITSTQPSSSGNITVTNEVAVDTSEDERNVDPYAYWASLANVANVTNVASSSVNSDR